MDKAREAQRRWARGASDELLCRAVEREREALARYDAEIEAQTAGRQRAKELLALLGEELRSREPVKGELAVSIVDYDGYASCSLTVKEGSSAPVPGARYEVTMRRIS